MPVSDDTQAKGGKNIISVVQTRSARYFQKPFSSGIPGTQKRYSVFSMLADILSSLFMTASSVTALPPFSEVQSKLTPNFSGARRLRGYFTTPTPPAAIYVVSSSTID